MLTEAQWRQILERFGPHEAWVKAKPNTALEPLDVDKLRAYFVATHDAAIRALIVEDKAVAGEIQQLQNLEKLLLYHQWLFEFVNNYGRHHPERNRDSYHRDNEYPTGYPNGATPSATDRRPTGCTAAQTQPPSTPASVPGPTVPETPRNSTIRDLMIGAGFLVAGVGTALKFLVDAAKQLTQPKTLHVLLIMIGVFLVVAILVAAISAWKKLRQRDLGVLLQASGWAINGRMRLIRAMARFFTRKARIPKGARRHRKELLIPLEHLSRKLDSIIREDL